MRGLADVGAADSTATVIATRGERLVLVRQHMSGARPRPVRHRNARHRRDQRGQRIAAVVAFDPEDFDAALEELDARYLAGEAAPYAHTGRSSREPTPRSAGTSFPADAGLRKY